MITISGSCIDNGQNQLPLAASNIKSASFPRERRNRWVISLGTTNTCDISGWANRSSLKSSTTVSIAAGGGLQSLGAAMSYSSNQSVGSSKRSPAPR